MESMFKNFKNSFENFKKNPVECAAASIFKKPTGPPKKNADGLAVPNDVGTMKMLADSGVTPNIAKGEKLFKSKCAACHVLGPHNKGKQGPTLDGVMGRHAAKDPGFGNYSNAQKSSGIIWDEDILMEYLTAPKVYVPGTTMIFLGLKKDQERADLISYITSQM